MGSNEGFEDWADSVDRAALAEIERAFDFFISGTKGEETIRKLYHLAETNGEDFERFWRANKVKYADGSWAADIIARRMLGKLQGRYRRGQALVIGEHTWPANVAKAKALQDRLDRIGSDDDL
jgi:hypothetical protein